MAAGYVDAFSHRLCVLPRMLQTTTVGDGGVLRKTNDGSSGTGEGVDGSAGIEVASGALL